VPHLYDGRDRTSNFVQYQGFRQVLERPRFWLYQRSRASGSDIVKYPDGSTDTLQVLVNPAIAAVLAAYPLPNKPNRRVWCANLCCAFEREHGHGSVFYPHRSESWRKRTIVWSINYDNLTGPTTNPDQNAARSELWRAVRGSASGTGSSLTRAPVTALSLVDIVEFLHGRRLRL